MNSFFRLMAVWAALALGGCATVIGGTSQTIAVASNPSGATCKFIREGSVVSTVTTPANVKVDKTKHDIQVECEKDGFEKSTGMLDSGIESATWGNIILGGGIGWAVDSAVGADNHYPENITITLLPRTALTPNAPDATQRRLEELQMLLDKKLITPSEYAARRRAILESV